MEEGATGPNGTPTPSDEAPQQRSPSPEGGAAEVVEFEVGEVVLVRNEDNLLQERKIAEISTRCHKRQYQKVYRLQPLEGLRKGKNEFLEASRIFKPTPTLIGEMNEAMASLESGRYDRGRGDDEPARRPQMKAGTSRDPSWWEYASDACSELDKGKGVALEDIIRHIDSELFAGQDRTCRSEVEAALTASVKSGHIFLSSEGRYTLAPDARRPRLKKRSVGGGGGRRASQERVDDDDDDDSTGSGPTSSVGRGYGAPRGGMAYGRPPTFGPPGGMPMPGGKGMGKMSPYGYDPAMMAAWQAYPGGPQGASPYYPPQAGMGGKPDYGTGAFRPGGARDSLNSLRNAEEGAMGMGGPSDFRGYFPPGMGGGPGMRYSPTMDPYGRPTPESMYRYPPGPGSVGMPGAYDRDMMGRPGSGGGGGGFRLPGVMYDPMGFPQGSVGPNGLVEQSRVLPPEDYTRMATPGQPNAGSVLVGSLAAAVMNGPAGLNYEEDDVDDDGQRLSHQEAARRQATAYMRKREEDDVFGRRISDSYDSKVNDGDDEQTKQYKRSCYELKVVRKKIGVMMDIVTKLKSDRKLLHADLSDAERKLANRQTRWETKEQKVAEMGMVVIADDLDVIATDTRKRVMAKQPPMPEPQVLHCPNLPPRAMADLLHVCDFVKAHATCLNVEPFPLLHLAFALGLEDGSLLREIHVMVPTGGRTVVDITEPSPYFLREYLMYFLRTLFFREARSGEMIDHSHFVAWATRGVELGVSAKWREVFAEWSDVLNPLTVSEILRRYLHAQGMAEDEWMMNEITDLPASFSPYGESFLADRQLLDNTKEALETKTFDELAPDHMLAVYRHLCDQLLDRPMVHEFIMSRTDYVNEMSFKLIEAEKEYRKAKKELNKGLGPGKEKDPLAVGKEAGKLDPVIRALTDRMQLAHDNLVKMQQAAEEAEKGMRRVKLQPLGEDRFRNQYWYMEDEPRLFVHLKSMNVTGLVVPVGFNKKLCPPARPLGGEWGVYTDEASVVQLIESLNQRALRESHLLYNLQVHFQHMRIAFARAAKMREQYNPTPLPSMELDNKSQGSEEASRKSSRVGARRSMPGDDEEEASMDVSAVPDDETNASVDGPKDEPMDESASVVSELRLDESVTLDVPPPVDKVKRGRSATSVKSAEEDDVMIVGDAAQEGAAPAPTKETRRGRSVGGNGGTASANAQAYVPMRPPHLITFEEVVDPVQCFRSELLSIEKEVWEAIKDSSLLRMCTTGTVEHRRDWLGAVDHASEATQLIDPLLQLEALFAQAMGFDNAVDEAIRLYNLLPSKKKRKPEPGEKKRRGRKPKASTIRKRTLAAQALLKQQQAEEAAAAAAAAAAAEEEQKDAMEVEGENGDEEEEGDEDEEDEEGEDEEGDEEGEEEEEGEDEEDEDDDEEDEEEEEAKADDTKSVEAEKPKAAVGQKRGKASIGKKKGGRPPKRARGSEAAGEAAATSEAAASAANGATPAVGEEGAAAPGAAAPSEEDQKTTNEIYFINGPLSSIGREVWRAEVEKCKSVSAVALSLYAFSRRAQYELPRLRTRVVEVTQRERQAKESVKNGLDGDLLSLPTMECLNVVWAKLPNNKGPYWPAIVHIPYSRSLRRLLREKNHHLIRFIGETPIYHLSRVGQLPFLNEQGNIPAENRGRGKAMAKALKVAHQLWARQLEKQKESFGMPFEGDDWGEEEDGEETEEEDEARARARASLSSTDTEGEEGYPRKRTSRGGRGRDRKSTDTSEAGSNGGGRASKGRRR